MKGSVLLSKKKKREGFFEREQILSDYLSEDNLTELRSKAKTLKCNPDDVMDAVCLAVTAKLKGMGMYRTIPENPKPDARGLLMQIVYPIVS